MRELVHGPTSKHNRNMHCIRSYIYVGTDGQNKNLSKPQGINFKYLNVSLKGHSFTGYVICILALTLVLNSLSIAIAMAHFQSKVLLANSISITLSYPADDFIDTRMYVRFQSSILIKPSTFPKSVGIVSLMRA